jgi:predicted DNA-binding transcriptional regulator YafY
VDRSERFSIIERLLRQGRPVTLKLIMEALGVSRATVKRDLEYLRDRMHAPIEYQRASNSYRFVDPGTGPRFELPGLWFNESEIHALLTMQHLLLDLEPGLLGPHVEPMLGRLRSLLETGDHSPEEVQKRIRIFQPGRRLSSTPHFGAVAAAVLKRRRLWIRHYNRADDRETEREISPQRLVHYRDNWYADAWCHLRKDLRSFAVDAMREARLLEVKAKEVSAAQLDEHLGSGYGIFAGRDVQWAKLRFSASAARWVSSQQWHPKQRASFEKDGRYVIEVPYADDRELVMEILKYGADVEVLSPAALRKRVLEASRKAAARYAP